MLQNKENLLYLQITQNTLWEDIPVCLWFNIYWYWAMDLFINKAFSVFQTCKSGGENLFVLPHQRVSSYTVHKDCWFCLFFKKDVKQWKFCTSKGNIGTDNKRSITVIFIINLHGTSLPMQLICCGENVKRLNKFDFLEGSPTESIKIIK